MAVLRPTPSTLGYREVAAKPEATDAMSSTTNIWPRFWLARQHRRRDCLFDANGERQLFDALLASDFRAAIAAALG